MSAKTTKTEKPILTVYSMSNQWGDHPYRIIETQVVERKGGYQTLPSGGWSSYSIFKEGEVHRTPEAAIEAERVKLIRAIEQAETRLENAKSSLKALDEFEKSQP